MSLANIRETLVGVRITREALAAAGYHPRNKGKFGLYNERLLGIEHNSSPSPDLGPEGELKTTVRDRRGQFRESIKVCMVSQDPLHKLEKIVLVIARDLNDLPLEEREVENVDVVLLKPTEFLMHVLRRDVALLRANARARDTYFLETRTAGQGGRERAFYIKQSRLDEYLHLVTQAMEFTGVRSALLGREVRVSDLVAAGKNLRDKGLIPKVLHEMAPARCPFELRVATVAADHRYPEDLRICSVEQSPLEVLRRLVLVRTRLLDPAASREEQVFRVDDVICLAPTRVVLHALEHDLAVLRGEQPGTPFFLKIKTHYNSGGPRRYSYYIRASMIPRYVAVLQNQPI